MSKRVLVLGASGFIGRRVVNALAATSWAIPVAARHRSALTVSGAQAINLDATDEASLAAALGDIAVVVNCVAGSPATMVAAARALFAAAAKVAVAPRIVHLSSMAVYGAAIGAIDEAAPLCADAAGYAAAKVQAEVLAASCPSVVILRPGCVYGPGSPQWSERVARWLAAHRVGDLGVAGDGCCNLVHVDDVAAAVLAAASLPGVEGQSFNLGSPIPLTWNEYFVAFGKALGAVPVIRISRRRLQREARLWAPPLKLLEIFARLTRQRWLRVPPPIPPSLLRLWTQDIRLDVRKAQRLLGVQWTPLAIGLRATAAQLQAHRL